MSLLLRWQEWLDNHGAPCFSAIAGNPNSGKTGMAASLLDWRRRYLEDARDLELLVVGNADESLVDERVTSAHQLAVTLIEADRPVAGPRKPSTGLKHYDPVVERQISEVAGPRKPSTGLKHGLTGALTACLRSQDPENPARD